MENLGWIKLHRKLLDNPKICQDSDYMNLWVQLLLLATHSEIPKVFNGRNTILKPGQLITGRIFLSKITKINQSKIERILKYLESEHQIEQQKTNVNRLITITNWNTYQESEQQVEHQVNNKRTTSEQRVNTYKNDKNEKNEKNNKGADIFPVHFSGNFIKAWNKWLDYREEIKKPLKNATRKSQMDFLKTYNEAEAIAIIMQSIRNGWQGLFEINKQTHGTKTNFSKASADEKFGDEFKAGQLRALGSLLEGRN